MLLHACPDLDDWPRRWQYEAADLAPGSAIVATFKPFLLDLLRREASKTTFNRDRRNLWQVGGEIIRRRHDDSDLKRLPRPAGPAVGRRGRRASHLAVHLRDRTERHRRHV